ncbi:MAG: penicillin-insensitive murein endopeptidase [Rhizobiales bacterium]|nr:penicillin-insensitive murein endopeptidase [Hyphomicrobiales bacterium]
MVRYVLILTFLAYATAAAAQGAPAKELFGAAQLPADLPAEPIGFYSQGCMAGAVQLPPDGPHWQAMRLSRNRHWGLPTLVDYLEKLAREAAAEDGWPGLLVGDMSQPRGGPMLTGHASHQTGLDVDLWLMPMPDRRLSAREREETGAPAIVEPGPNEVFPASWTDAHARLIRRASLDPRAERIFVAPGIKKKLCETAGDDRDWLRKVRPYYGHHDHLHVRLSCPPGTPCRSQSPPPPGDGCGADLAYWFSAEPYKPPPPLADPAAPPKEMMLAELPPACREVLAAPPRPGAITMVQAFAALPATGEAPPLADATPPAAVAEAQPPAAVAEPEAQVEDPDLARLPRPRPNR